MSRHVAFVTEDDVLPHRSAHTVLIAAARSCGFRYSGEKPFLHTVEELPDGAVRRRCVYTMDADQEVPFLWVERLGKGILKAREERLNFATFRARFEDPAWVEKNPDHPIAYLRAAFLQHRSILSDVRQARVHLLIRRGATRFALIPADATEEQRAEMLSQF